MNLYPKFRNVRRLRLKGKNWDVELPVPSFNWKYLPSASAKGGRNHILFKLNTEKGPKENEIVQLKKDRKVVGFVIPGAALTSLSHKFAADAMFGPFALIALQKIAERFSESSSDSPTPSSLGEIVDQQRYYCIVNAEECEVGSATEFLDKFFPQLLSVGFVDGEAGQGNPVGAIVPFSGERAISISRPRKISAFVRKALFGMMPYESNPFFSFFYAWQIVEHFMHLEFERRLNEFVAAYDSNSGVVSAKKSLDKINEIAKEKNRVRGVFSRGDAALDLEVNALYKRLDDDLRSRKEMQGTVGDIKTDGLKRDENELNASSEAEQEDHLSLKLYYIRNVMFHSFSDVEKYAESMRSLMVALVSYLAYKCANER